MVARRSWVRPGDPGWPSDAEWAGLGREVGDRLVRVRSPLDDCAGDPAATDDLFRRLRNPYFLGDEPGLTQTLGWVGAWTSQPSTWAVAATTAADVSAAVGFARRHGVRLVVKGGGHSYQGTSSAPDSLLVWTRPMQAVSVRDDFVPAGCDATPVPAVSVGAGALWGRVYDAVTTRAGRYVQGGGCLTVGVAGLVLGGGFGSFSKAYGTAAASLLEAEVVTADGAVRIVSAASEPELFWGLKGGGGGSLGVVTRLTLRTHDLPERFGAVQLQARATSAAAYRRLVARVVDLCADTLTGPQWGEQLLFGPGPTVGVNVVFQGLTEEAAGAVWEPLSDWIRQTPADYRVEAEPRVLSAPAHRFWDPDLLRSLGGIVLADDRPGAPAGNVFWAGNRDEAGQVLHAYQSLWLPARLLTEAERGRLTDALVAAAEHHRVSLHLNKGLAGATPATLAAARDTATNPAVLDAFALAIVADEGAPAHPDVPGHEPDLARARDDAAAVARAMGELRTLAPEPASYLAESDYFEEHWRESFWGANYPRLAAVKERYDPDGLFAVHHGVGSDDGDVDHGPVRTART